MNIVTISGSARPCNYTSKALILAQDELKQMNGATLTAIEPTPHLRLHQKQWRIIIDT
jgi:hypothetical protein